MQIQTFGAARTMSTREIAELTGKLVKHVNRDAEQMIEDLRAAGEDGPDLDHVLIDRDSRGYIIAIHLPQGLSITLVTGYSVLHRHRIVKRWQELESQAAPAIPQTYAAALRLAAEQAEQIEQQAAALALAAPKVEFVERYVEATGTQGFREVCKLLGAKEPAFRAFLAASEILYKLGGVWVPYSRHIDAGRFVVKTGSADNGHAFSSARFTAKGVEWVSALWRAAKGGAA